MENPFDSPAPVRFPRTVVVLLFVIAANLTVQTACSIVNTSPWTLTVLQTWFTTTPTMQQVVDDARRDFKKLATSPRK
jgi:flagellar biosynthesis protein FliP